jgi:hypothetical protein
MKNILSYIILFIMETIKTFTNKIEDFIDSKKLRTYIDNPYIVGTMALLVTIYSSFIISRLSFPRYISSVINHSAFRIVFIFVIVLLHKLNPMVSLTTIVIFICVLHILPFYYSFSYPKTQSPQKENIEYQKPSDVEMSQIKQESSDETMMYQQSQLKHQEEPEDITSHDYLHPKNKPADNTLKSDKKYLPNELEHPSHEMYSDPELHAAIYELNPPYAQKDLPLDQNVTHLNPTKVELPPGGPTRYSAYHGYKLE